MPKKPDLPFVPLGLSRTQAAAYIGVSATLFDEMVRDGRMPPAKQINSRRLWDRREIEVFFTNLPGGAEDGEEWEMAVEFAV